MNPASCYHCGLPNPDKPLTLTVEDQTLHFCCTGCRSAAKTILDAGLGDYYRFYTPDQHPVEALESRQSGLSTLALYDRADVQQSFVQSAENDTQACVLSIEGISCSACSWLIEKRLQQLPGVQQAHVNASTHRLSLNWDPEQNKLSEIMQSIFLIGYKASPFLPDEEEKIRARTQRQYILRLGIAGIGMMQAMMNAVALYSGSISEQHELWLWWTSLFLTLPVIFVSAWPFFTSALNSLRQRHMSMDVSVSLAILSAFGASCYATFTGHGEVYYESVNMFTFFLVLSRFLEFRARTQATRESQLTNTLMPQMCRRVDRQGVSEAPLSDIANDDVIRLMPGETSPFDGIVVDGQSQFDESSFTGEFKPIDKRIGDTISAGTTNRFQRVDIRVTRERHSYNLLTALIERGSADKSRLAVLIDQGARQFIWSTLIIAGMIGLIWLWIDPDRAFWIVISVLVVTCPCALSLATPTALAQATLSLKRHGFVITRGYALERLSRLTDIAFDKTGTLTEGRFYVTDVELTSAAEQRHFSRETLMSLCAALEANSEHPIAEAFSEVPSDVHAIRLSDPENLPGQGVMANSPEGRWFLGQDRDHASTVQEGTSLRLTLNDELIARLTLNDRLRPTVPLMLNSLNSSKIRCHVLTGDHSNNLRNDIQRLGLNGEFHQGCTPEDKVRWVEQFPEARHLAVIGDGLNDAPLLAHADLSIAMLNATDLTKSQADVLMLTQDLQVLSKAVLTARKTHRIIRQNLSWALLYNVIALPLAAFGWVTPWQAAIGMSLSSLFVVGNALRLRKI
ncbi:heavy metal translocating P-type ATPase [Reinekea blandensis]|uniref:Cation transport ATPase, E1-E2 family protein n=1 Tax=Reinekea blandensis MED297 TaxID=314283 RepID=A4BCL9_9GAMM|nr:heavy metal translocating P-type ATPase [Reinekea blandensis]EAR10285.1 Cation transport ATPase, E1-E2 family protein [Reinekea sp. MED297] [Reinekea blandensis MED297]